MTVADLVVTPVDGSVSAPAGFRAAGVACGIKKSSGLDLALIVSDTPASRAAVFTTNKAHGGAGARLEGQAARPPAGARAWS